ncbi:YbaN family protein [Parahaliea mediterranea]|uniref:YbaN family protein n=1 Tax=Parahaliea mediterranea TaxID=651086 RepID=UPI001F4D63BA|nr:YbaN family protein [Parahaliea mediterranea]
MKNTTTQNRPPGPPTPGPVAALLWRFAALLALLLGAVGIVLPGLPTVPFWLLAAWCASRGWPAVERWLLAHPRHGPSIRAWRERGAVPRRAKWSATLMMALSSALIVYLPLTPWVQVVAPATMLAVAIWLWRRPEDGGLA